MGDTDRIIQLEKQIRNLLRHNKTIKREHSENFERLRQAGNKLLEEQEVEIVDLKKELKGKEKTHRDREYQMDIMRITIQSLKDSSILRFWRWKKSDDYLM